MGRYSHCFINYVIVLLSDLEIDINYKFAYSVTPLECEKVTANHDQLVDKVLTFPFQGYEKPSGRPSCSKKQRAGRHYTHLWYTSLQSRDYTDPLNQGGSYSSFPHVKLGRNVKCLTLNPCYIKLHDLSILEVVVVAKCIKIVTLYFYTMLKILMNGSQVWERFRCSCRSLQVQHKTYKVNSGSLIVLLFLISI